MNRLKRQLLWQYVSFNFLYKGMDPTMFLIIAFLKFGEWYRIPSHPPSDDVRSHQPKRFTTLLGARARTSDLKWINVIFPFNENKLFVLTFSTHRQIHRKIIYIGDVHYELVYYCLGICPNQPSYVDSSWLLYIEPSSCPKSLRICCFEAPPAEEIHCAAQESVQSPVMNRLKRQLLWQYVSFNLLKVWTQPCSWSLLFWICWLNSLSCLL